MMTIPRGAKVTAFALGAALCLFQARCAGPFGPDDERPIAFRVHEGYSVKSSFGVDGSTYGLVFTDKEGFDSVLFRIGDHNPHEPIPDADFQTRVFPVVIKRGNSYWEMNISGVKYIQNGQILNVYFRSTLVADNMSWVALIPLVASVQAGEYSTVNFYENGEFLTSVPFAR